MHCTSEGHKAASQEPESFLCFPGIILAWGWDGPRAFPKEPINFPGFQILWMGLHPLVRLTGLHGPASPLVHPNNLALNAGEERSINPLGGTML